MPLDQTSPCDLDLAMETFQRVRAASEQLAKPLTPEDWMLQSMEAASPVKWNLAHTSWFFETFVLKPHCAGYAEFDPLFRYLFNSYYNQIGEMHQRGRRGMISRPTRDDVLQYRDYVTENTVSFLKTLQHRNDDAFAAQIADLIALGCAHEEQHQELLLTDIKHAFYENPRPPAIYAAGEEEARAANLSATETHAAMDHASRSQPGWVAFDGGLVRIGRDENAQGPARSFAFDNEGPAHEVYLKPFALADRPVSNIEYLTFMQDGGYEDPRWWLADGWALIRDEGWNAPLYWFREGGEWSTYGLNGLHALDPHAPVAHISFYEAAAYAEWSDFRLPSEAEWEHGAEGLPVDGNFLDPAQPREPQPMIPQGRSEAGLCQMFGDVWEWTASPYTAYPGYRTPKGAIGEYNGKFMSSQMVLRGGSCATAKGHIRPTYRNFFPPDARWQFSGLRLARDLDG